MPRAMLLGITRADLPGPVAFVISYMLHLNGPIDPSIPGVRGLNPPKVVHALEED
jgi:hypothetical protein